MVKWGAAYRVVRPHWRPCSQVEFGPYSILFVVNKGPSTKKINIWTLIHYKHFTSTAHCKLLNHTLHSCSFLIKFSYETLIIAIVHKLSWTPVDKWASKYAMRLSFFWLLMTELFCLQNCGHGINKQRSKTLDMTLRAQAFKLNTWEAPLLLWQWENNRWYESPKRHIKSSSNPAMQISQWLA